MTEPVKIADTDTVEAADLAWCLASANPDIDVLGQILHEDFTAVHGAPGLVQDRDTFLKGLAARGGGAEVELLSSRITSFGDVVIIAGIQEMRVPFIPGEPLFTIQAAITRAWIREGGFWKLAHLQMARRIPPG